MVNTVVYEKLKEIAREGKQNNIRGIIFYENIMLIAGLDRENPADREIKLCKMLDDINRKELAEDRPMITAIVVHKHDKIPGNGFFNLARDLGKLTKQDERLFWVNEIRNVWEYWSKH